MLDSPKKDGAKEGACFTCIKATGIMVHYVVKRCDCTFPTTGSNLVRHNLQSKSFFSRWEIETQWDISGSPRDRKKEQWLEH